MKMLWTEAQRTQTSYFSQGNGSMFANSELVETIDCNNHVDLVLSNFAEFF